jgi:opacity protein-like surface antigen
MIIRRLSIGLFVYVGVLIAAPALADGFVTPSIGANFGGDAGSCANATGCSSKHMTYGVAAGFMGGGILGIEEEVQYAPNFFGSVPTFGNNSVLTAMTNIIVGAPLGPIRPYVSGGIGVIRLNANLAPGGILTVNNTSLGYDLGGGVMGFFTPHVGLQADYHYIRNTKNVTLGEFSITNTQLNFSRGTVGVVFRF